MPTAATHQKGSRASSTRTGVGGREGSKAWAAWKARKVRSASAREIVKGKAESLAARGPGRRWERREESCSSPSSSPHQRGILESGGHEDDDEDDEDKGVEDDVNSSLDENGGEGDERRRDDSDEADAAGRGRSMASKETEKRLLCLICRAAADAGPQRP